MAFYDNIEKSEIASISILGGKIIDWENNYFLKLIKTLKGTNNVHLLEIGPGRGFFARVCGKTKNIKYVAIEANELMSKKLIDDGYNVFNLFVPPIPLEETFDVIFMNQVFEHMKNRDQALEMIQSCREHLNDKGLLIISSPDILFAKEDFFSDYTHDFPTSPHRLFQIFFDNDLKVIYLNHYSFFFRGYLPARFITFFNRLFYKIGVFDLFFGKKAYKVMISLLPSFVIVGVKR